MAGHGAVVPDVRIGHHHHLTVVARIGKDLLVAGHAGVEAELPAGGALNSDGCSVLYGSVSKCQNFFSFWIKSHRKVVIVEVGEWRSGEWKSKKIRRRNPCRIREMSS